MRKELENGNTLVWLKTSQILVWFSFLLILVGARPVSADIPVHAGDSATVLLTPPNISVTLPLSGDTSGAGDIPNLEWSWSVSPAIGATIANPNKPVTSISFTQNGRYVITLVVQDGSNKSGETGSSSFPVHVNTRPYIVTQPVSKSVPIGTTASFSVQASGYPAPTYQWFRDGKLISSATSASYTTPVTTSNDNGAVYYVEVTNLEGTAKSQSVSLTVQIIKPTITQQPRDTTVTAGGIATFKVAATGTAPLSYTWYRNDTAMAGTAAASSTLSLSTTERMDGFQFHCVVKNDHNDSVVSNKATLTVLTPPKPPVFTNPIWTATGTAGELFSFQLTAVDGEAPLVFSSSALPSGLVLNASTGILSGTPASKQEVIVTVKVTDANGLFDSKSLSISIGQANSKPVILDPANANVVEGDTAKFTVSVTGTPTPSLIWQKNNVTIAGETQLTLKVVASAADNGNTYRAIATNSKGSDTSAPASLTVRFRPTITQHPANTTALDGATATFSVRATGNPLPSYQWRIGGLPIANAVNATYTTGRLTPQDNNALYSVAVYNGIGDTAFSNAAKLTVQLIDPSITVQPVDDTANEGGAASFSVTAVGSNLTYQWRRNGVNIVSNAVGSTYPIPSAALADSGVAFDCVVTGTKQVISTKAYLIVKSVVVAPVITNANLTFNAQANTASSYAVTTTGTAPTFTATGLPTGLAIHSSTGLISGTPTQIGTSIATITATNSKGSDQKSLTVIVSAAPTKPVINSPSSYAATIGVNVSYTIAATGGGTMSYSATGLPSPLTVNSTSGLISGIPSATGTFTAVLKATNSAGSTTKNLNLTVSPANQAPKITTNLPDTLIRKEKQTLTLTVAASGYPTPTYQWEFINSQNQVFQIGTGSTYRIDTLSLVSAGTYRVIAKNGISPDAYSTSCRLTVNRLPVKPTITGPTAQLKLLVGKTDSIWVNVNATPTIQYQWKKNGIGPENDIVGEKRSVLTFKNATLADSGTYYCLAWGGDVNWSDTNTFSFSTPSVVKVSMNKVDMPKANPASMSFTTPISVALRTDTLGTTIRYTLDGKYPTSQSPAFQTGSNIPITATTTLIAQAFKTGLEPSDYLLRTYTYQAPGKVALAFQGDSVIPAGGRTVTLTATPTDAEIWYTKDGTEPSQNGENSFQYDPIAKFLLFSNTTIKARAFKAGMEPSETVSKQFIAQSFVSKIAPLEILPNNPRFTDSTGVRISSLTDSVTIWYTLDGSNPLTSPTKQSSSNPMFWIHKTTRVKAIATRANWENSDSLVYTFYRVPGPIILDPPNHTSFDTKLTIRFFVSPVETPIYCTVDNSQPLDLTLKPTIHSFVVLDKSLTIMESTTLTCVAMGDDGIPSDTLTRFYMANGSALPPPIAEPSSRSFRDTLRVALRAAQPFIQIQYTTNGDDPDAPNAKTYKEPLLIDSTMTIRAMATFPGFNNSRFMMQTYTLVPDTPSASPGGGTIVGQALVTLSNRSKKVDILYTLNGESPSPANGIRYTGIPIPIRSTSTLQAIAVAGNMASSVLVANYTVIDSSKVALRPNATYVISNTPFSMDHSGEPPVDVLVGLFSPANMNTKGFTDASFGFILTPLWAPFADTTLFPTIQFNRGVESRALYRMDSQGKVYFVSNANSVKLQSGGTYFLARDTTSPKIEFVSETFVKGDSTEVRFLVTDNVSNLSYTLDRSDIANQNDIWQTALAPAELAIKLKSPPGEPQPLELSFSIHDGMKTTRYPSGANQKFNVGQSFKNVFGIQKIRFGEKGAKGWDLVSLPVNPNPPLTSGSFWAANPSLSPRATYHYDAKNKSFQALTDDKALLPGHAYWMAANSKPDTIRLPQFQSKGFGAEGIQIRLTPGWNLVGNPTATPLYWPIPRSLSADYQVRRVKAPWAYDPVINDYNESDSLLPWRGYWVFLKEGGDTVITLSKTQIISAQTALAKSSALSTQIEMTCRLSQGHRIRLGAIPTAQNRIAMEDEPAIPLANPEAPALFAMRERVALQSDWVQFKPGSVLSWTLVLGTPSAKPSETPEAAVEFPGVRIPEGYLAAVVSTQRKIQYPIQQGTQIPPPQSSDDSLSVWVGPAALMKESLNGFTAGPPPFARRLVSRANGWKLQLDLPESVRLDWIVCDALGHTFGEGHSRLQEGHHQVNLLRRTESAGILFVRMVIRGKTLRLDQSFRLTSLPN
jgi:Putative Ig domain/Chitobiase/beta-hexosaminidase C-terminal domain/Fn3 associated/Immunoglobulin domain/Immunoglobulin I-set domain